MRKELDDGLCRDFPLLYRDRTADPRTTCMCWGFPGDGWEPLIRRASEKLEPLIAKYAADNPGVPAPAAMQVKEKFGTLRFYMTAKTDEMSAIIDDAEAESAKTCETCGAPGKLLGKGWLRTACADCAAKR